MYNGYSNYETWLVAITIANTESLYNFFQDLLIELKETKRNASEIKYKMADTIKTVLENMMPETNNPIWGPLLNSMLESHIDYDEVVESIYE